MTVLLNEMLLNEMLFGEMLLAGIASPQTGVVRDRSADDFHNPRQLRELQLPARNADAFDRAEDHAAPPSADLNHQDR